jgi:hypothetical protein
MSKVEILPDAAPSDDAKKQGGEEEEEFGYGEDQPVWDSDDDWW